MTMLNLIESLKEDLQREYAHWHFYMHHATRVRGPHRLEISEFLLEQAASEMKHIEQFQRLLTGLSSRMYRNITKFISEIPAEMQESLLEIPSLPSEFVTGLTDPVSILNAALEMEEAVVAIYTKRLQEVEALYSFSPVDSKYIQLFLEDQLMDSRSDADNIREMLY